MNDNDYKRLGCAFDGCGNTKVASLGLCGNHYSKQRNQSKPMCSVDGCDKHEASKGLCGSHYTRMRSFGYTGDHSLVCECCGIEFKSSMMRATCSSKCKDTKSSRDRGHAPWDEYVKSANEKVAAKWSSKCCAYCGGAIPRLTPSGQRKGTSSPHKTCSKACDTALKNKVAREIASIRAMRIGCGIVRRAELQAESQRRPKALVRLVRILTKIKNKTERVQSPCARCGNQVGTYSRGRVIKYCTPCRTMVDQEEELQRQQRPPKKIADEIKEAKRADRNRRKAMERGAKVGAPFTFKQVFERDGWKCQLCGKQTPPKHRGTYKPTAPELDHVIPLSKGGEHSMQNTQCLCRSCNAWKSDKLIPS